MTSTTDLVPAAEPPVATLIKTDVLGRMHRTREQRERILDEYERSRLSGWKFATLCGVKYQTFATWLQRRKRQRNAYPKRQPQRKSAHSADASLRAKIGSSIAQLARSWDTLEDRKRVLRGRPLPGSFKPEKPEPKGYRYTTYEMYSSVSGGINNTASGKGSSVSGGFQRLVTGEYNWEAGTLFQDQ